MRCHSVRSAFSPLLSVQFSLVARVKLATACPFCYIMLDDGVKGAGVEEDEVRVADISIHLLDAIEQGEQARLEADAPLSPTAGD